MSEQPWHLYLLRCNDGSLYTGITVDVERRMQQHAQGTGAKRLRGQGPLVLAFSQEVGDRSTALRLEYRVKKLTRAKKEALIAGQLKLPTLDNEA